MQDDVPAPERRIAVGKRPSNANSMRHDRTAPPIDDDHGSLALSSRGTPRHERIPDRRQSLSRETQREGGSCEYAGTLLLRSSQAMTKFVCFRDAAVYQRAKHRR